MWPVGLVGGLLWEGPICKDRKVVKFHTAWMPERAFPVDMAAFSINIHLLFEYPTAYINPEVARGFLETDFLEQLKISRDDLEAKADDCTKVSIIGPISYTILHFIFSKVLFFIIFCL